MLKIGYVVFILTSLTSCVKENVPVNHFDVRYNIIKPETGIYAIIEKDVNEQKLANNYYEKNYYRNETLHKIERYNLKGQMTDELSVSAITKFEYDSDNNVKFAKYFYINGNKAVDKTFGFHSIEYIYDNLGRVKVELYRDEKFNFLKVPRNNFGEIEKTNFLSAVIVYEYLDNKIIIKALDQNFNLLKEVIGEKPCLPFIDCGEKE